jgi:uncharacterized membrane protein
MNQVDGGGWAMQIASVGKFIFAGTMIVLGIVGLFRGNFTVIWQPVPEGVPARVALIYLCALVSLGGGVGLLFRRTATIAARLLLGYFLLWLVLLRVPGMLISRTVDFWWATAQVAVMTAAAWVLWVWFADDSDKQRFGSAAGENGLRLARALYGLGMIPFGIAHFVYLQHTAEMVPAWLPWHVFWAKFFGWTFIAAGVAMIIGVCARLAATLSAVEMGLFLVLVWVPVIAAGSKSAGDWSETLASVALAAAAWVVAESYRGKRWVAFSDR